MQTLVTGGAGYIGRHLVATLLERGLPVRVLDTQAGPVPEGAEWLQGSVLDEPLLARAMEGVEWVFHLAAIPHLWIADKRDYLRVNLEGTQRVLAAAQAAGVERFVHTSTEAVLSGTGDAEGLVDGRLDPDPDRQPGPYSRSKALAEQAVLAAARQGLKAVIVSPTAPLGPGDESLTPPTQMLLDYLNGRHPAYLDCLLNLADVRDVAEGHLCAAARGRIGRRYLLGGENLRLAALLERLQAMTGLAMPKRRVPYWLAWVSTAAGEAWADHVSHRPPAASLNGLRLVRRPLRFESTLAAEDLEWRSRPLAETLADTLADLRRRGLLLR